MPALRSELRLCGRLAGVMGGRSADPLTGTWFSGDMPIQLGDLDIKSTVEISRALPPNLNVPQALPLLSMLDQVAGRRDDEAT